VELVEQLRLLGAQGDVQPDVIDILDRAGEAAYPHSSRRDAARRSSPRRAMSAASKLPATAGPFGQIEVFQIVEMRFDRLARIIGLGAPRPRRERFEPPFRLNAQSHCQRGRRLLYRYDRPTCVAQ
jgi:hypothetical protein